MTGKELDIKGQLEELMVGAPLHLQVAEGDFEKVGVGGKSVYKPIQLCEEPNENLPTFEQTIGVSLDSYNKLFANELGTK